MHAIFPVLSEKFESIELKVIFFCLNVIILCGILVSVHAFTEFYFIFVTYRYKFCTPSPEIAATNVLLQSEGKKTRKRNSFFFFIGEKKQLLNQIFFRKFGILDV